MFLNFFAHIITVEIFGGSYYLLGEKDLCKDKQKVHVKNLLDCKEAAKTIPHVSFVTEETSRHFPSGCYVYGKGVYFNDADSESRLEGSRSICRADGKKKYSTVYGLIM